ncbi:uncharacterized protein LOC129227828 [Uloborus diversus]|uniref:uncharacterized protein LOC129227828 n=1 Tax=Uloborus diversus TaxID=327109 RepID=UPI00240A3275|nr:uncharacterized protein LOC129227828 [Uloborus diversus]
MFSFNILKMITPTKLFIFLVILTFSLAELDKSKIASTICGEGGTPKTTPSCIPKPDPTDFKGIPSYTAFVECWPKVASCAMCQGDDSKKNEMANCTKTYDCAFDATSYASPDVTKCYWEIFCKTPAECQIQYEQCVEDSAEGLFKEFRDCVEKNV